MSSKKKRTNKKKGEFMEIQVSRIKEELNELNNLIENYQLSYLNLYNIVNDMSHYWQDHYSELFFKDIEIRKIEIDNTISEINNIKSLYNYLVYKYENIGNNIKFNLSNKESVYSKIDNCLNQYQNIINSYNSLDLSFCGNEVSSINSQISRMINAKNTLSNYKEELRNIINYIEEIEREITRKISGINIEDIKDQEIGRYV